MNSLIIRTPGRRKAAAITLLAFGWILLAWFMGVLVPASAQDETDPSGKLVAAPSSVEVGDSIEVVAFEVQPANLLVAFQYDEHLVRVGEACDDAATRTTPPTPAPVWIPLEACTAGEGRVRLLEAATETVIAETTITIAEAGDGVSPQTGAGGEGASGQAEDEVIVQQQGCGQMFELPCPPAPNISYTTSPSTPSSHYSVTVRWGVGGCDNYSVSGDLGNYEGSLTSKTYPNRPCEDSYNVSAQSFGDGVHYEEVWSDISSRTVTIPDCPVTTPTPTPTNNPPAFSSASTSRSVPENTPSGRNIGSPVTATDQDGDSLTYSIGGTDASSFSIVTSTGQLRTSAALDYETKSSYSVTVTAEDPSDASNSIVVTINVTDVDEGTDPVCSTPSSVRNLEVDAGDRRLDLDWERPSDDGDCDIEYNVKYKLSSSSIWGSTDTVTTSRYSITDLANGTKHDVQVQACNDARCGLWSEESGTPQPPVPGQVPRPMLVPADQELDVAWNRPQSGGTPSQYNVRYRLTSETTWSSTDPITQQVEGDPVTKTTIPDLTNDMEYEVRVRACNGGGCGLWSRPEYDKPGLRYARPKNLDVQPRQHRMALLTWEHSSNHDGDTEYHVFAQTRTGAPVEIGISSPFPNSGITIRLDEVIGITGLGEESYFRIWLVARDNGKTDPSMDESAPSDAVRIIDSPIVSINGNSVGPQDGEALVKWDSPSVILGYTIRWRKLVSSNGRPHSNVDWRLNNSSLPSNFDGEENITDLTKVDFLMDDLDFNAIYAVQLNYKTTELVRGPNRAEIREITVFSARDRFVWTSNQPADGGRRIATIPLVQILRNKTYSYVFCEDTFPEEDASIWKGVADHSFKQWMIATDKLITIDHLDYSDCADYSLFLDEVRPEVIAYVEEYIDVATRPTSAEIEIFVENFANSLDAAGYESTRNLDKLQNEVLMIEDVDEPLLAVGIFSEVSSKVGHGYCGTPSSVACAYLSSILINGTYIWTTDILLKERKFQGVTPEFPFYDIDEIPQEGDVVFNQCRGISNAYAILVHEMGHALGIRGGIEGGNDGERLEKGHPTIKDSALNSHSRNDPYTCSPNPLDIMGIYAIYQTD